jgi:NADH-quinone oxidoreductase subunit K
MIPLEYYLVFSAILFSLSLVGIVMNRKNIILLLMCVELMLLAVNTNLVAFSDYFQDVTGQIFVFFILTVAAAEAAIGLAIVLLFFRQQGTIDVDTMHELKG